MNCNPESNCLLDSVHSWRVSRRGRGTICSADPIRSDPICPASSLFITEPPPLPRHPTILDRICIADGPVYKQTVTSCLSVSVSQVAVSLACLGPLSIALLVANYSWPQYLPPDYMNIDGNMASTDSPTSHMHNLKARFWRSKLYSRAADRIGLDPFGWMINAAPGRD